MDYSGGGGGGGRRRCSANPQPDPDRTHDNHHHNEPLSLDDHHSQSAAVSDDDFYYYHQVSSFLQHHTTDHQSFGWAFQPPTATTSSSPSPVVHLPPPFSEADEPTGSSGSSLINPGAFRNTASALDGSTSTPAATATTSVSSSESEDQPDKSVVGGIRAEGVVEKSAENTSKGKKKVQKRVRQQRFAFMTKSEVDHLEDGYRWRKYGQKAVKNSPFPRSYYRCTNSKCTVKKRVERSSEDPAFVITTYEGQHCHHTIGFPRGGAGLINYEGNFGGGQCQFVPPESGHFFSGYHGMRFPAGSPTAAGSYDHNSVGVNVGGIILPSHHLEVPDHINNYDYDPTRESTCVGVSTTSAQSGMQQVPTDEGLLGDIISPRSRVP